MFNRYYEDELNKLKGLAVEFAQNNPALAPMLSGSSADPDVERLLEGVAFLTGLTRQKLDDEFPEFVQELANLSRCTPSGEFRGTGNSDAAEKMATTCPSENART